MLFIVAKKTLIIQTTRNVLLLLLLQNVVDFTTKKHGNRSVGCVFLEDFRSVTKKVVVEQSACSEDEIRIEMLPSKQFVHVAAVAAHLLGKPSYAVALLAQLRINHSAKMDVVHGQAACFFLFGRLPDAVICLSCFIGT